MFGTAMASEAGSGGAQAESFAVDLCDRAAVKAMIEQVQPDVVVHLAGDRLCGKCQRRPDVPGQCAGHPQPARSTGSVSAPSQCRAAGLVCKHLWQCRRGCHRRKRDAAPANDYAVSKLAMEYMARLWMDRLPIILARPFNYTGVGQTDNFLLPKIVSHFRRGASEIELGNLAIARDFSDVRAVVRSYRGLIAAAPDASWANPAFNVCSGQSTSLQSVIAIMEGIAGYQITVKVNREFYQGVLQVAVALHHWRNGNFGGAISLLKGGVAYLSRVSAVCQWVDVAAFIAGADRVREALEQLGKEGMAALDLSLIPVLRVVD